MRTFFIIIALAVSVGLAAAPKVYKKINPDGSVEYSDKPMEGAELMYVPKGTVVDLNPDQQAAQPGPVAERQEATPAKPAKPRYTRLEITRPYNDTPLRSNAGFVTATVVVEPELAEGDYLKWTLDGEEVPNARSTNLQLENVDRGTHKLQVTILNEDDVPLKTSNLVTFHLLRYAR